MIPSSIARRYAEAAFDVARQENDVADWLSELQEVMKGIESESIGRYFHDPNVSSEEKIATITAAFADVRPQIVNLLKILTARNRLHLVPAIVQEMKSLDRADRNVVRADVTVARPVTEAERADIARQLGSATGKHVEVTTDVDPDILGGVVVRIGDRLIDASITGRLEKLRQELAV